MRLQGKIVLVTGGNSGIGRAIALRAAAEGARVAITGRDPTKGARVLIELQKAGAEAAFIAASLGEEQHAADLIAAVTARFGGIEAYVDFAGGEKRAWLHGMGMRWFPVVGWAERGGYGSVGHGNSVPRFHVTWGTGHACSSRSCGVRAQPRGAGCSRPSLQLVHPRPADHPARIRLVGFGAESRPHQQELAPGDQARHRQRRSRAGGGPLRRQPSCDCEP